MLRRVWVALLLAGTAHAGRLRLDTTPGACDLAALRDAVSQLVPDGIFDSGAAFTVRVEAADDAPTARIWFTAGDAAPDGPRTLRAASCSELVESAALVIAMHVSEIAPVGPRATAELEYVPAPDERPPPVPPSTSLTTDVFAGAAANTSGSHEQLLVGARWRRGSHSITVSLRRAADATLVIAGMSEVTIGRTDVTFEPCIHAGELGICAIGGVGVIRGSGQGLLRARAIASPIAFVGAALAWERSIGAHISLRMQLEANALLRSIELDVDDMPVWSSSPVEAAAGLALLVHFP